MTRANLTELVRRPRLLDRLEAACAKRGVLIVAPAGFGKTMLIEQFLATVDLPVLRVNLEEAGRIEHGTFCQMVLDQAARVVRSSPSPAGADDESALDALRQIQRDVILVVDRWELVDSLTKPGELLHTILSEPGLYRIHVMLASRILPSFAYTRLLVQEHIALVDAQQLAFTNREVAEFCERTGESNVLPSDIRSRWRKTGGWIAGLVLSAPAAGGGSDCRNLFKYLDGEVFAGFPAELADFAVNSACLENMSAELCDSVLGVTDSFGRLQALEERNLFVSRAGGDEVQFHPLFRQFLLSKLPPVLRRATQAKAGELLEQGGDVLGAARHFAAARAWDSLRSLLERHGRSLLDAGYAGETEAALEELAASKALSDELLLLWAEAQMQLGSMNQGARALSQVNRSAVSDVSRLRASILDSWVSLFECRPERALKAIEHMLASGEYPAELEGHCHRSAAAAYRMLDRDDDAEIHTTRALHYFQSIHNLAEVGYEKTQLGNLHFNRCEPYKAIMFFREAADIFRKLKRFDYLPPALNNLGHLLMEVGRLDDALTVLIEARQVVEDWPDHPVCVDILQNLGVTYRALRKPKLAEQAFRVAGHMASALGYTAGEQSAFTGLAIAFAEIGRADEARSLIESIQHCATPAVKMRLLMAELSLAWATGMDDEVLHLCDKLLLGASGHQYVRYIRAAALFRLGSLVRIGAPTSAIHAAATTFIRDSYQPQFAALMHHEVARVAAVAVRDHPDPVVRNSPVWKWATGRVIATVEQPDIARQRPSKIEVLALQSSLHVRINGNAYRGSWQRALDLFLYLVHHPQGGTAVHIGTTLWGNHAGEHAIQQRFHTMVAALRRILGERAIVRDTTTRPSVYRLHPDIAVSYDVQRFQRMAQSILEAEPNAGQVAELRDARRLYARPFWPARALRSVWFTAVSEGLEGLLGQLVERETELTRTTHLFELEACVGD